ncbi:DUF4435 domain-containing protein [Rhizobium redzepovicii]|uniref:DUF4435 domain-containing protein n=2 Tax=Rhizobium TaxID=379 RepID=A0A3S0XBV0_9HYPH|nr:MULTISPECIES: DUF4435 domain-containing protein [Rhizobium]MBA1344132.1 AAA family ATPase [Rhizobium sp. WYCCWR 11146]MDR9763409.1 DUF4435 domain-containing protein [Rhizobium redzepovicii]MDR9785332.1 DUF4435 domain-containing protein [Rhizobium redzepovicii]RUL97107.1 DUF4435 domain-containing protein [Rhizobium anhuiense]GGE05000.1 hypothetical protein GCM10008012_55100 [Rhizobium anhuiense]
MSIGILTPTGECSIEPAPGRPIILLGPNGTGKSRLGIHIDNLEETGASYRIGAQRSLELPDEVFSERYERAIGLLRRDSRRVQASPGSMEHNYDEVLVALFAERLRALELAHEKSKGRKNSIRPVTVIDRLQELWHELIPSQSLLFSEATVRAVRLDGDGESYEASAMSDGERLVLYILGQVLLIETDSLLIVDEPELHMNRSLLVRLWDLVERARPDCSFLYVTHDIDFAASRRSAQLYAVLNYVPATYKEVLVRTRTRLEEDTPAMWTIEPLPSATELPRDLLVRMVGSRKPILFVEGKQGGLDETIYRAIYGNFTVIPSGSCGQVIQFVRSFRKQEELHWLHCAGLVDRDNRDPSADGALEEGIFTLPVLEVENLLLAPEVFFALAEELKLDKREATRRFDTLTSDVFEAAGRDADRVSLRHTSNVIWQSGKSVGAKAKNINELSRIYAELTAKTDPSSIYSDFHSKYQGVLAARDFEQLLLLYDNKNKLLDMLGKALDLQGRSALENLVSRLLVSPTASPLTGALVQRLPVIDTGTY